MDSFATWLSSLWRIPVSSPEIQYAVAAGNPFDGIALHGPFALYEDALVYLMNEIEEGWVVELMELNEVSPDA